MENAELRDFEISLALDKDLKVDQFAKANVLADLLNEKLKLKDYSRSLNSLLVVFQCFHPDNKYIKVEEQVKYKRKSGVLEVYLIVDYEKAHESGSNDIFKLLLGVYENGTRQMITHNDFDTKAFVNDAHNMIEKAFLC